VLIIGKVVHLEADDRFFNADGSMNLQRAKPLSAMLGKDGMSFTYPAFSGRYADYREMFLPSADPGSSGRPNRNAVD
jgi:hypothetical protein